MKEGSPYLRALGKKETIGLYLKSLGTACSRKRSEKDALHWYREAVDQYRHALSLDPAMAAARGNLAAALCNCGCFEDGILEFLKALEINPSNALVRAGLAKAYFALGAYREASEHCDLAMGQGYRFEPSMLEVLDRHRPFAGIPVD